MTHAPHRRAGDTRPRFTTAEARWRAVSARDARADGRFLYAVRTTGVYCRPGCAARLPLRRNVEFFDDADQAEAAGFRACRRCRPASRSPGELQLSRVVRLCRLIDGATATPTLGQLARAAGLSPFHTQRLFRQVTGLTPRQYAVARRRLRVAQALPQATSITQAMLQAGYGSSAQFYSESREGLGMTPRRWRSGAAGLRIEYATARCSLGRVLVACTPAGVCAILLGERSAQLEQDLAARFAKAQLRRSRGALAQLLRAVVALVERPWTPVALPLDIQGTAFQQRVWQALRQVPAGSTVSYAALAARVNAPRAARAVAGACAANPLAIAIPCHRVVRADGSLSGYRWGEARKRALLQRESR